MQRALGPAQRRRAEAVVRAVARRRPVNLIATSAQRLVDRAQHAVELVAAAHDQAGRRDHAVGALAARQLRILFDAVERDFAGAAEHRKHRAVSEEIDGVVAPFAGGDLAAVEIENAVEFAAAEGDLVDGGGGCAGAAPPWDWLGSISPGPNVMRRLLCCRATMIAPPARRRQEPAPRREPARKRAENARCSDHEFVRNASQ